MADGTIDPNNFVVSWESPNAKQKVMASFTKGLSTFKGTPATQCQFISNGSLPNAGVLECVVSSKAAEKHHAPSRPLTLISPDAARHDPIFSLAA